MVQQLEPAMGLNDLWAPTETNLIETHQIDEQVTPTTEPTQPSLTMQWLRALWPYHQKLAKNSQRGTQ